MYTVGYAWYYGFSLIVGDYTCLFLSIVAHAGQLLFLVYVEDPHMEKLYGKDTNELGEKEKDILYNPEYGLFPGGDSFDIPKKGYKAMDILKIMLSMYIALVTLLVDSEWFAAAQCAMFHFIHYTFIGFSTFAVN
eukprot:UN32409